MNEFIKGLMSGLVAGLARSLQGNASDLVKIRAAIWYLRAIRTVRQIYLLSMAGTLTLLLVVAGFVLFHIGLFAMLPTPANAIVIMVLGLIYMVAGLCILRFVSSEKQWMQASGAAHYTALVDKRPGN